MLSPLKKFLSLVTILTLSLAIPRAVLNAETCSACYDNCTVSVNAEIDACELDCDPTYDDPSSVDDPRTTDIDESDEYAVCLFECSGLDTTTCDDACDTSGCTADTTDPTDGSDSSTTATDDATDTSLTPPFGSAETQREPILIIAVVIQALLGLVGAGALLMFVYGGFYMIFSAGSEERITKGKRILIWAVVGLVVVLSSYAVLSFLFDVFRVASGA